MRKIIVTPMYPALIVRHNDLSQKKLVLIATVPAPVQPQYIILEIRSQAEIASNWLRMNSYMVRRSTLVAPFLEPDGELILQRWNCFFTVRPLGKVVWTIKDGLKNMNLMLSRHLVPASVPFFCLGERFDDPIEERDLCNDEMAPKELSSSSTPEYSPDMIEDEFPRNEMQKRQTSDIDDDIPTSKSQLPIATPEHDLAKLLPTDPFDMGSSDFCD